jgi:hypothetical protein
MKEAGIPGLSSRDAVLSNLSGIGVDSEMSLSTPIPTPTPMKAGKIIMPARWSHA